MVKYSQNDVFFYPFKTFTFEKQKKFDRESSLDAELNSASKEYPLGIILMGPTGPKTRNT